MRCSIGVVRLVWYYPSGLTGGMIRLLLVQHLLHGTRVGKEGAGRE